MPTYADVVPVTKRSIMSHLGKIYDPIGIVSPTMAEGKRIFRGEEKLEQRSIGACIPGLIQVDKTIKKRESTEKYSKKPSEDQGHLFAYICKFQKPWLLLHNNGGNSTCHRTVKGLLASKSQIAANMANNLCSTLNRWSIG